jgi:uncharacterized protein (DUF488 family)
MLDAIELASPWPVWQEEAGTVFMELMTIGYEGLTPREFYGILRRCRVQSVVDIRELPISRKAGFAKSALSAGVEAHGMCYRHVVELGCPREVRHDYRADGDWPRYAGRFKTYLETQTEVLGKVAGWAEAERCCLLCFEEDYRFCHRSFVADRVAARATRAMRIQHLTGPMRGRVVLPELATA